MKNFQTFFVEQLEEIDDNLNDFLLRVATDSNNVDDLEFISTCFDKFMEAEENAEDF